MQNLKPSRATPLIDFVWRLVLRFGFSVARIWWRLSKPHHRGALVAIYVGDTLLLVKSSYRSEWSFPGGSLQAGEAPEAGAVRELAEEIGLPAYPLHAAGTITGLWDGRTDHVHFFDLHLHRLPELKLDNREIVATRLVSLEDLHGFALTGPVVAYLNKKRDDHSR